jgi:hypothetical protein
MVEDEAFMAFDSSNITGHTGIKKQIWPRDGSGSRRPAFFGKLV